MLSLLFEGRFEDYVSAFRSGSHPWLFVHVPKTAGSSLRAEIAKVLKPEANIFIDHGDKARTHMEKLDHAAASFIERDRLAPHRFASGHLFPQQVDAIRDAIGEIRCITMLRQPVKRFISDYRYQCSPMHPGNEGFRERFPRLVDYLRSKGEHNKATRYLVPAELMQRGDQAAILGYVMEKYHFVGLQEMYPLAFRALFALMGEQRVPTLRIRVNEDDRTDQKPAPDIMEEIEAANALDMAVYNALLARWKSIREPFIQYLQQR